MLETLSRCHLLIYDPNEHRYTMHPLVQHFATARLSEDERSVFLRHAKHYATVAEEVEQFYQMGDEHLFEGLKMFDRERFNIDTGWSRAREWGDNDLMLRYSIVLGFTGMLRYDLRYEYLPRAQETLEIAQRLRRRDNESHALNDLGYAYNILGELEEAVNLFTHALRILRTSHNLKRKVKKEGSILSNLGQAYIRIGNTPKAIEQSKLRIELAQASNDWRGEGIGLNNLGLAFADLGKTDQAIAYFQKSLDLSRKYGDRNSEATDLGNLGRAYVDMGEIEQAVDLCEQALDIKWELGNSRDEGYALHFLGVARAAAGEHERAREHQQQALTLAYEVGDRWLEARVINSMGEMSLAAGEQAAAIEQFEQALDIARTTGDRRGVALASWNLGRALEQQGPLSPSQAERVIELLQERVSYEQSIGHAETEAHAETLEQVRERLGVAPPAPATTQNSE
jgi:tetratricopeptide (TPR) repeat protein